VPSHFKTLRFYDGQMYSLDGAQLPRGALSNRLDGEHGKDDDEDSDEQNDNHDAGKDKERRRNVS
jgi:hypothetical protein